MTARGDTTALHPRLKPLYHEMLDLGLVEAIEDFVDFDSFFRGSLGLNAHESYGYLAQPILAEIVGGWLERTQTLSRGSSSAAAEARELDALRAPLGYCGADSSCGSMMTSMRRLRSRPCSVSLLAIGCVSP